MHFYAQIAQLVEQWTENPRVTGSIPVLGTINARVAQGWSTTLPRLGSRVRIPSRALLETGMCKHSGFCVVEK